MGARSEPGDKATEDGDREQFLLLRRLLKLTNFLRKWKNTC